MILRIANSHNWTWPGASEVWVYGTEAAALTTVSAFVVADIDEDDPTRSALTTGTLSVAITAVENPAAPINGYMITVNDSTPPDPASTDWVESEITQFSIPDGTEEGVPARCGIAREARTAIKIVIQVAITIRDQRQIAMPSPWL